MSIFSGLFRSRDKPNIKQKNVSYETDIKANAKGFEYLGKIALRKMLKAEKQCV